MKTKEIMVSVRKSKNYNSYEMSQSVELDQNDDPSIVRKALFLKLNTEIDTILERC